MPAQEEGAQLTARDRRDDSILDVIDLWSIFYNVIM